MNRIDLRFVVIDCVKESWRDLAAREAFTELVQLRIDGYGEEYAPSMLPLDQIDWIATHLAICRIEGGRLRPILGYRMATRARAAEFGLDFPGVTIPGASGAEAHAEVARETVRRCEASHRELAYVSSWTIAPDARADRELTRDLKEMTRASHVLLQETYGIDETLVTGVLRFHSEKFQATVGYRPLSRDGGELPAFKQRSLAGEPVLMLHLGEPSELAREDARRYRSLWDRRIVFSAREGIAAAAKKAA